MKALILVIPKGLFYDPQKVFLHKYQSPVSQALYLCLLKIPSRSSTLGGFFRHKKTFTIVKAFDTCERHRHYFELIFERFGGVVCLKRRYKLMYNRYNVLSSYQLRKSFICFIILKAFGIFNVFIEFFAIY